MTDAAYFASYGISQSGLKHFRRSPAHYLSYISSPPERTPAMRLGSLFDSLVFTPEDFERTTATKPKGHDGRTTAGKDWVAANPNKEHLHADEMSALTQMRSQVKRHPIAGSVLLHGAAQIAVFEPFVDGDTKIQRKAKIDWVPPLATNCLVDLKTTTDARAEVFERKIWDLDYHVQAAYYLDLWNAVTGENRGAFVFIAVETEPPYAVNVFNLKGEAIERGRQTYIKDLQRMIECRSKNEWPAYSSELIEIGLPRWTERVAA